MWEDGYDRSSPTGAHVFHTSERSLLPRNLTLEPVALFPMDSRQSAWLDAQLDAAITVFSPEVSVAKAPLRTVSFDDGVVIVDDCDIQSSGSSDQNELFQQVQPLSSDGVLVFAGVRITGSSSSIIGCAWHPPNILGCMVRVGTSTNTERLWIIAHELGHVLGLEHVNHSDFLMHTSAFWTQSPPFLAPDHISVLRGNAPSVPADEGPLSQALTEANIRYELLRIEPRIQVIISRHGHEALPILRKLSEQNEEHLVRIGAMSARLMLENDAEARDLFRVLTKSDDVDLQSAAAYALRTRDVKIYQDVVEELLLTKAPAIKKCMLQGLRNTRAAEFQASLARLARTDGGTYLKRHLFAAIESIPQDVRGGDVKSVLRDWGSVPMCNR